MARKSNRIAVAALLLGVCTAVAQQRQQKISELPQTHTPQVTDWLPLVHADGTAANKISIEDFNAPLQAQVDANGNKIAQRTVLTPNLASLRAIGPVASDVVVMMAGYATADDGGGGQFSYSATSTASDDGGTVIQPTGVSGTGRFVRPIAGGYNVRWFGAKGDNVADDTAAIRRTIAAENGRGEVVFPPGDYLVTSQINITNDRTHLRGSNLYGATVYFNNATPSRCFNFAHNPSSGSIVQCSIRDLSIFGQGTVAKTAIAINDHRHFLISNVTIRNFVDPTAASIGLLTFGRDMLSCYKTYFEADYPIWIDQNGNNSIDSDYYEIQSAYLLPGKTYTPCIYVAPNADVFNLTVLDTSATFGQYFIYAPGGGTNDVNSINWNFKNVRKEQGVDGSGGWTIYIDKRIQNLILENVRCDIHLNGIYLRRCDNVTAINVFYPATTYVSWDIDNSDAALSLINCLRQTGSTMNMPGMDIAFAGPPDASTGNRSTMILERANTGRTKDVLIYNTSFAGTANSLTGTLPDADLSSNVPLFNATSWSPPQITLGGYDNLLSAALGNCTGLWVANFNAPTIGFVTRPDGSTATQMTSTASGAMSSRMNLADFPAVTAGSTYTGSVEFQAATTPAGSTAVNIVWYDVTDTQLSATLGSNTFTDNTTGWTQASVTGVAPTGAVKAQIVPIINSPIAGSGVVHYFRRASLQVGSTAKWQNPIYSGTLTMNPGEITAGTWKDKMQLGGANGSLVTRLRHGTATLSAGTATVTDANVTANTRIIVARNSDAGTVGASYSVSRSVGANFTITAKDGAGATQSGDTSTVAYELIEP